MTPARSSGDVWWCSESSEGPHGRESESTRLSAHAWCHTTGLPGHGMLLAIQSLPPWDAKIGRHVLRYRWHVGSECLKPRANAALWGGIGMSSTMLQEMGVPIRNEGPLGLGARWGWVAKAADECKFEALEPLAHGRGRLREEAGWVGGAEEWEGSPSVGGPRITKEKEKERKVRKKKEKRMNTGWARAKGRGRGKQKKGGGGASATRHRHPSFGEPNPNPMEETEQGQVQGGGQRERREGKGRDGMEWGSVGITAIDPFLAIPAIVMPPAGEVTRGETPDPILGGTLT
ncbi:hypothetical protein BJV77DRAFT_966956 [Russula vinacea]|nr:hypothetical protein BJV77DRAFT_966956 [Russula vinacea]